MQVKTAVQAAVTLLLSWTGGAVDAIGYLLLYRLFTAQMSGNTVALAVALGRGDRRIIVERGSAIAAFVAGVLLGACLLEIAKRRFRRSGFAPIIVLEIALLGAFWAVGAGSGFAPVADSRAYFILLALAAPAMGLQNATLQKVGGTPVHTTFVTGVLQRASESFVAAIAARLFDRRRDPKSEHDVAVLAPVYACYFVGGFAGAAVYLTAPVLAPITALAPLVCVAVVGIIRDPLAT